MSVVIWMLIIQSGVEAAQDFTRVLTFDVFGTLNFHSHLKQ
jgi:hypothetical protein